MVVAVTCADSQYRGAMEYNKKTALKRGKVDRVYTYNIEEIDADFARRNERILSQPRGHGYWLWKSYFIHKALSELSWGDYLIYSDAGAYYGASVIPLLRAMENNQDEAAAFLLPAKEYQYTKRDVFVAINADEEKYTHTNQRMGGFLALKKTDFTVRLVEEWLRYAQQDLLVTDAPNALGKDNYEGFIEHRHDQSVWSVLTKKMGVRGYRDATQNGVGWGISSVLWKNRWKRRGTRFDYPVTFILHRQKTVNLKIRFEIRLQYVFPKAYRVYRKFVRPSIF